MLIFLQKSISMSFVKKGSSDLVGLVLDTIEIFGVKRRPNEVMCNCLATSLVYSYNPLTKVCEQDMCKAFVFLFAKSWPRLWNMA